MAMSCRLAIIIIRSNAIKTTKNRHTIGSINRLLDEGACGRWCWYRWWWWWWLLLVISDVEGGGSAFDDEHGDAASTAAVIVVASPIIVGFIVMFWAVQYKRFFALAILYLYNQLTRPLWSDAVFLSPRSLSRWATRKAIVRYRDAAVLIVRLAELRPSWCSFEVATLATQKNSLPSFVRAVRLRNSVDPSTRQVGMSRSAERVQNNSCVMIQRSVLSSMRTATKCSHWFVLTGPCKFDTISHPTVCSPGVPTIIVT